MRQMREVSGRVKRACLALPLEDGHDGRGQRRASRASRETSLRKLSSSSTTPQSGKRDEEADDDFATGRRHDDGQSGAKHRVESFRLGEATRRSLE